MIDVRNIHSLSDFQRNTKSHIKRLKKTGEPELLTINGEAEVVVQDAVAYQKLLKAVADAKLLDELRISISQADRGEGRPMRDVLKEIASEAGVTLRR